MATPQYARVYAEQLRGDGIPTWTSSSSHSFRALAPNRAGRTNRSILVYLGVVGKSPSHELRFDVVRGIDKRSTAGRQ